MQIKQFQLKTFNAEEENNSQYLSDDTFSYFTQSEDGDENEGLTGKQQVQYFEIKDENKISFSDIVCRDLSESDN